MHGIHNITELEALVLPPPPSQVDMRISPQELRKPRAKQEGGHTSGDHGSGRGSHSSSHSSGVKADVFKLYLMQVHTSWDSYGTVTRVLLDHRFIGWVCHNGVQPESPQLTHSVHIQP
jgi:hypothetical protein